MPRKQEQPIDDIKEKLEYIGLDLENIPENLKEFKPLKYRAIKRYEDGKYKQYRYVPIKDIEIILSPTNRLDDIKEKYAKASPVYSYLVPDKEQNIMRHTTFLNMLKNVNIEDIERVEEEQKNLMKTIPFNIKYTGNYLWQIYYSETTDRYFMLVPTEDTDYSTFFYLLKKKLEKKKLGKIFVPITNIGYSNKYLKNSQFEDIENYLWAFTKEWPSIYEVYDKKGVLNIQIIGTTEVYEGVKSLYKIKLKDRIEVNKFYKLLKALFMLQTEVPHYFNFSTGIDRQGRIEFFFDEEAIEYDDLPDFIKKEYYIINELDSQQSAELLNMSQKLEELKMISSSLEIEYLSKEKQISTFLECKKSFFGKVKYLFKYNKKAKGKGLKEKIVTNQVEDDLFDDFIEENNEPKNVKLKDYYTIEELIEYASEYITKQNKLKNLLMDINALKLKNKNLTKKLENATAFIEEIDSHKKSIFEFWKYSNKDEMSKLPEGEEEEINVTKKISKVFNYKAELKDLGLAMDKQQRKELSEEELDSLFITTTDVIEILNKVKTKMALPKDIDNALKKIKNQAIQEKALEEKEDFDIFGGKSDDNTKIKKIADKKHRELPKDKYDILDLSKNTKQIGYKLTLERIIDDINSAISKIKITENVPAYLAINGEKIDKDEINIFNLNPEEEVKKTINEEGNIINLYKVNIARNSNAVLYTNSVFYDNKNKTLPLGMDLSTNILFDMLDAKKNEEKDITFRVVQLIDGDKAVLKRVNVIEYDLENNI